jgi:hypothetical protein
VRRLLPLLGLGLAIGLVAVAVTPPRLPAPGPVAPSPTPASLSRATVSHPGTSPEIPRNIFEYGSEPGARRTLAVSSEPEDTVETVAPSPPPERVRLVGIVSRAGKLRAALAIEGEIALLTPGDEADGYTLLSVDRDAGVRVRAPGGSEISIPCDR